MSKSKTDQIREFLELPDNRELSNKEVANRFGCNEGTVRRARTPDKDATIVDLEVDIHNLKVTIDLLSRQNDRLQDELRQYRTNQRAPRKQRSESYPLFGETQ